MEDLLGKIVDNTSPKSSFQIVVSDNKTRFKTKFNPPLQLDKNKTYEIALVNLETYYSFPNITAQNSVFRYSPDAGGNWFDINISVGSYDIEDLNDAIQQGMRKNGHYDKVNNDYYITLSANPNTLRSILNIQPGYQVMFKHNNSLNSILGFESSVYTGYAESEHVVNILSINSILVNIDIISGSYVNGTAQPTIFSFFPDVSPGYKIIENPRNLVYLPVTLDTIHHLETWLTDQDGKLLNLRGESVTVRFHLKEI